MGRDWTSFPREEKPNVLSFRLGRLYHNGTALYQNEAVTRDILYALNGRRTNRARIGDEVQIFVCSPQYIGEGQISAPTNCKSPRLWPKMALCGAR
jgi:hypothetical protein